MDLLIWIAFALAQLADVWTTNKALNTRGLKEAHPLWRWVQARMGRAWWVARLGAGVGVAVGLWWALASIIPVAVITLAIGGVAANNWRLIKRARK